MKKTKSLVDLTNPYLFQRVFKLHYSALCGLAFRYLSDHDLAEDIVQGVFTKVWENAGSLEIRTNLKSYLMGAVRHACLNHIKHENVRREYSDHMLRQDLQDDFDVLEWEELQYKVKLAIEAMPEKCRHTFELSRFSELKYTEIAEKLNVSIKTVETQMSKALKIMREYLRPE